MNVWRWFRRHEAIALWLLVTVMLAVVANLVSDVRHQGTVNRELIARLDARQNQLCVEIKKGRIVFKNILDANGLVVSTRVSIVDCPPPVIRHN